jgi:hypothetical protein
MPEATVPPTTTPQWKLRRLAARVLRVQDRQRDTEPALAAFDHTLVPATEEFIVAYGRVSAYATRRAQEHREGKTSIAALGKKTRVWAVVVAVDTGTFKASDLGKKPDVPDAVIADAEVLMKFARGYKTAAGKKLPYLASLEEDLGAAIAEAKKEWDEAETAASDYNALRRQAHDAAYRFERHLIAYRRALKTVIGRAHPDYQKLRAKRARSPDRDDDQEAADLHGNRPRGESEAEG